MRACTISKPGSWLEVVCTVACRWQLLTDISIRHCSLEFGAPTDSLRGRAGCNQGLRSVRLLVLYLQGCNVCKQLGCIAYVLSALLLETHLCNGLVFHQHSLGRMLQHRSHQVCLQLSALVLQSPINAGTLLSPNRTRTLASAMTDNSCYLLCQALNCFKLFATL